MNSTSCDLDPIYLPPWGSHSFVHSTNNYCVGDTILDFGGIMVSETEVSCHAETYILLVPVSPRELIQMDVKELLGGYLD